MGARNGTNAVWDGAAPCVKRRPWRKSPTKLEVYSPARMTGNKTESRAANHTQAKIAIPDGGTVNAPIRTSDVIRVVVPGTAALDTEETGSRAGRIRLPVRRRTVFVSVPAPVTYVSAHVV